MTANRFVAFSIWLSFSYANSGRCEQPFVDFREETSTKSDIYGDPLPAGAIARLGTVRLHSVEEGRFAFAVDGRSLITAQDDEIVWWDATSGKRTHAILTGSATYFELSATGSMLATVTPKAIRLWDTRSRKLLRTFGGGGTRWVCWTSDEQSLLSWEQGKLTIWNAKTGEERLQYPIKGHIERCDVSSDFQFLVRYSEERNKIWILNLATGVEVSSLIDKRDRIIGLAFSHDVKFLATAGTHGVRILNTVTGKQICAFGPYKRACGHIEFTRDDKKIVVSELENKIHILDTATGKEIRQITSPKAVGDFRLSPNGKSIASFSRNTLEATNLAVWDLTTAESFFDYPCHAMAPTTAAISPDGATVASSALGSLDVYVWDGLSGKLRLRINPSAGGDDSEFGLVYSLAFLSGGKKLHGAICDNRVHSPDDGVCGSPFWGAGSCSHNFWDVATGKQSGCLSIKSPFVLNTTTTALSGDGKTISTVFHDDARGYLAIGHAMASGKQIYKREGRSDRAVFGIFSPNGLDFVQLSDRRGSPRMTHERKVVVQNIRTGQIIQGLETEDSFCPRMFTPDGLKLYGENPITNQIVCFNLTTGKALSFIDLPGSASCIALSADGRVLAAAMRSTSEISLWDTAKGSCIVRLKEYSDSVTSLALSSSGKRVVTGLSNGSLLVWDMADALQVRTERISSESFLMQCWQRLKESDVPNTTAQK